MKSTPLEFQTIDEIGRAVRSRAIGVVELTRRILDRIESTDPQLHSYATVMAGPALDAAQSAEDELLAGRDRGPLHGVPVAVKDLCFTRGVRTMGGTEALKEHVPDRDATVVRRLTAAGAIMLGKLNLTEGAMSGYHPEFEIPVNPWAADRWSGASSSGSGVATAAGLCYASLGSDTGGSIRFPAAACGTSGLKPTWGRVSRYGVLALAESLDHVGPLARSARDCAVVLEALSGADPMDPTASPEPALVAPSPEALDIKGVKIGLDQNWVTEDVHPEVAQSVLAAVEVLQSLGAEVVEIAVPPLEVMVAAWDDLCSAEAVAAHSATYPSKREMYGPYFRDWLDRGAAVTGVAYARAHHQRLLCAGHLRRILSTVEVLVCPSMPDPAHVVSRDELYGPMGTRSHRHQRFTVPFDYSGSPTLSVPSGFSAEGLPLSLQLAGRHMDEALLCRIGMAYQKETDWHLARPDF